MSGTGSSHCFTIAALMVAAILIQTGLAYGTPILTVTPNVPFRIVLEGDSGLFIFTVKNVGTEIFTIDLLTSRLIVSAGSARFGNTNEIREGIEFISGDRNDEVFDTRVVLGQDFCTGFTLGPQGTCVFKQSFDTRDLNKPASDTNSGIWRIWNLVEVKTESSGEGEAIGNALVEVLDPEATPKLPEPSTITLFGLGAISLIGYRLGTRRKST